MTTNAKELRAEAAAWRRLAEWCATKTSGYLCLTLEDWGGGFPNVYGVRAPFQFQWSKMHARIGHHSEMGDLVGEEGFPALWDTLDVPSVVNSNPRVIFCLLMAHECEDEARGRR